MEGSGLYRSGAERIGLTFRISGFRAWVWNPGAEWGQVPCCLVAGLVAVPPPERCKTCTDSAQTNLGATIE